MSTPTHPLAIQDHSRIDILYGGTEAEVIAESLALTRDLMEQSLRPEEQILYINTLLSASTFEPQWQRALRKVRQNHRFRSITLLGNRLGQKLEFLKKTIAEQNMRYVVLNGFEFG